MIKLDITEIDKNIRLVIVNENTRYLLQRGKEDTRWHVYKMIQHGIGTAWVISPGVVDIDAYSNDIIERIQLGLI